MIEKVRIPNSVSAQKLLPYLEQMDESRTYSNFGNLNFHFVQRLRTEIFASRFHVTTHCNGTQALVASILATAGYATPDKKFCLISSYTFVATAAAAKSCGYEPFFVDINSEDLMMDPKSHLADIPWDRVGLMTPTCAYGIVGRTQELIDLASEKNIPIVIDGAACFDTLSEQLELGKDAVFVMSTHATKSFNSGEGGLAVCKRPDLSRKIRSISNFGMDGSRISKYLGTNSKMSEYHAAVGLANLDAWGQHKKALKSVRETYFQAFTEQGYNLDQLRYNLNGSLAYFLLETPAPESILSRLTNSGIDFRFWYGMGLHNAPLYANHSRTGMETTDRLVRSVIGLPMHIFMSEADIDLIVEIVGLRKRPARSIV